MPKFKNILFWSFVTLALIGATYAYFSIKESKKPQIEALSVLPDSCLIYFNTNDFFELNKRISSQSLIADKLKLFEGINPILLKLHSFDSILNSIDLVKQEFNKSLIHVALYNQKPDWLMALNIKQLGNQKEVSENLKLLLKANEKDKTIFTFEIGKSIFFYSLMEGIVSLSNNYQLIQKALDKTNPKFFKTKAYDNFKATLSEDNSLSIFINHQLYSKTEYTKKINLSILCEKGFTAGRVDIEPSGLKITGFMIPDTTELISVLSNEESQSPKEILSVLPINMTSFKSFGFKSFSTLLNKLPGVSSKNNNTFWNEVNDVSMYNLKREFDANTKNHLISFETAITGQNYVAAQIKDTLKANEHLKYMSDSVFTDSELRIFQLKKTREPLHLFAPILENRTQFACIFNSYLLLANNKEDMQSLLGNLTHDLLAIKNESFNYYRNQHFPDVYNYLFYTSPNANRQNNELFFKFKSLLSKDPYETLKHFSFSLINDANAFKFRLHLMNEAVSTAQDQNVLWTLKLDTLATKKACSFVNHISGENEIIIQDEKNRLYLINAKGTVLWTKILDEKIVSEIYLVDIFKNNKHQMLFNTKNHIYLIDRNGNYVKGYPIDLPAEATSQISLLDYDNDKDYRIFIACRDNSIYNYNPHGMAQEGFMPVKTEHEVALPIQYVKVGKSDYLVALDKEGKIYTFSRKGQMRIGLKNRTLANCPSFYVDATNNLSTTNLVCVDDKSGLINKISFVDKKELIKLNMEHGNADVKYELVDDNRDMDILITINGDLLAYNFNGDLLFEKNTGAELSQTSYSNDESHSICYSLNGDKTEIIINDILKQKTKKLKGIALPLVCNLFSDNKKYLIITNGNQLSCIPVD